MCVIVWFWGGIKCGKRGIRVPIHPHKKKTNVMHLSFDYNNRHILTLASIFNQAFIPK